MQKAMIRHRAKIFAAMAVLAFGVASSWSQPFPGMPGPNVILIDVTETTVSAVCDHWWMDAMLVVHDVMDGPNIYSSVPLDYGHLDANAQGVAAGYAAAYVGVLDSGEMEVKTAHTAGMYILAPPNLSISGEMHVHSGNGHAADSFIVGNQVVTNSPVPTPNGPALLYSYFEGAISLLNPASGFTSGLDVWVDGQHVHSLMGGQSGLSGYVSDYYNGLVSVNNAANYIGTVPVSTGSTVRQVSESTGFAILPIGIGDAGGGTVGGGLGVGGSGSFTTYYEASGTGYATVISYVAAP